MKILALEKEVPHTQATDFTPFLSDEAEKVYELYLAGTIREFYFHKIDHTAVLVLECSDVNEAYQALGDLPLVKAGLIKFEFLPLAPYPGLSRLFKEEDLPLR